MSETVGDGVVESLITDSVAPVIDGHLAGEDDGDVPRCGAHRCPRDRGAARLWASRASKRTMPRARNGIDP